MSEAPVPQEEGSLLEDASLADEGPQVLGETAEWAEEVLPVEFEEEAQEDKKVLVDVDGEEKDVGTNDLRLASEEPTGQASSNVAQDAAAAVSSITFHDLGYEVSQRRCFKRLPDKIILDSVRSVASQFCCHYRERYRRIMLR